MQLQGFGRLNHPGPAVNPVSFARKHWLLILIVFELILAAGLIGWLAAGALPMPG